MDSLEAYDQHDEEQKNSSGYKALMISIACIVIIVGFFAMMQIGWKLTAMRSQTRPLFKRLVMIGLIISGLIALFLVALNYWGKRNEEKQ